MTKYQRISTAAGKFGANCHILICEATKKAVVFDVGGEADYIKEKLDEAGAEAVCLINTHGHWDHIGGNEEFQQLTGAPIWIHEADADFLQNPELNLSIALDRKNGTGGTADRLLHDGDVLNIGELEIKVIHTPGHTQGGCCFLCEDLLITGDTLFRLSVGRSDLVGGDSEALMKSLKEKIAPLDPDLQVLPGHGPGSTLGFEVEHNPFMNHCR